MRASNASHRANRLWRSCVCSCVIIARRVVGAVLVVVGAVWIGQGTQLIQGSSMSGSTFWAIVGALCVIAAGEQSGYGHSHFGTSFERRNPLHAVIPGVPQPANAGSARLSREPT
jgi:hypothetical protein